MIRSDPKMLIDKIIVCDNENCLNGTTGKISEVDVSLDAYNSGWTKTEVGSHLCPKCVKRKLTHIEYLETRALFKGEIIRKYARQKKECPGGLSSSCIRNSFKR